jgi:carotenoid cleavage dioxygenase
MSDYRHGWTVGGNVDARAVEQTTNGLVHYDLKTGKSEAWSAGPDDRFGEPIFVPRHDGAAEGDGWVLSVLYRAEEKTTDLAVFEATDLAKGPIARAHLSSRVPAGFHGNWRPGTL